MTDTDYQFVSEWSADTDIGWWNAGRTKLNPIIKAYNEWQINGFDADEAVRLRAQIICGMQTFGKVDGGSSWLAELEGMLQFVESRSNNTAEYDESL